MSNALGNEDLVPEQTEGFKVGEKKTIDEYQKLGESTMQTDCGGNITSMYTDSTRGV